MQARFKKLHPDARKPTKGYAASAAYDAYPIEEGTIPARGRGFVRLGFACEFEEGYVALMEDRSSMGGSGMTKLAGVIDPDYRGEWNAWIYNTTDQAFRYGPEKAIIQILFLKTEEVVDVCGREWAEHLNPSHRGERGYGSSDKAPTDRLNQSVGVELVKGPVS